MQDAAKQLGVPDADLDAFVTEIEAEKEAKIAAGITSAEEVLRVTQEE